MRESHWTWRGKRGRELTQDELDELRFLKGENLGILLRNKERFAELDFDHEIRVLKNKAKRDDDKVKKEVEAAQAELNAAEDEIQAYLEENAPWLLGEVEYWKKERAEWRDIRKANAETYKNAIVSRTSNRADWEANIADQEESQENLQSIIDEAVIALEKAKETTPPVSQKEEEEDAEK